MGPQPAGSTEEGVRLARERAVTLRALLERDPAAFVRQAMPAAERARLPVAVQAHVEQRIRGRGFYGVSCAMPQDGDGHAAGIQREAIVNGVRYRVFAFGAWRDAATRRDVVIEGVALGDGLAVGDTLLAAAAAAPTTTGTNTLLYIIARFSDQGTDPVTEANASNQMNVVSTFAGRHLQFDPASKLRPSVEYFRNHRTHHGWRT